MSIFWFDKPTIAYCPDCDCDAVCQSMRGLRCPECGTDNLCIFEWDGESRDPTED